MCSSRFILYTILLSVSSLESTPNEVFEVSNELHGPSKTHCLLRAVKIPREIWNHWAGYNCYGYTNVARLLFRFNVTRVTLDGTRFRVPVAIVDEEEEIIAFFDYTIQSSMSLIRLSFKNEDLFNNFIDCCEEAAYCCQEFMNDDNIEPSETRCPAVWDAWSCFPPTDVNTTARLPCSRQAYQSPENVCHLESEKYCVWNETTEQAEWDQNTNYNICTVAGLYRKRHKFHVTALAICIALCLPAITIFLIFQNLRRSTRVALHRNLLIAVCVRNVLTIMSKSVVILDALRPSTESRHVMEGDSVACRVLAFFENSAKNCIYACMLLDGWYLHRVIVRAFAKKIQSMYLYMVLAGLALVPSLIWATAMGIANVGNCWMVDDSGLQWIVDGYRIAILVTNTFLLIDIIRVMCMKLNQGGTDRKTRMAFRATLFLIPLFGVHILVTAKKITYDDSCTAEDLYDYSRYAMEALQGIWVAILFCYVNSEVHDEIRNGFRKFSITVYQRYGINLRRDPLDRRGTTATYVKPGAFE